MITRSGQIIIKSGETMNKLPIADIMMIDLMQNGVVDDQSNQMRTHLFCMDIENVSKEIDINLPEDMFIDQFVEEIQKSSGYLSFTSFCEVDDDGIRDLGQKSYRLLK